MAKTRILLVDDHRDAVEVMAQLLDVEGFEVKAALDPFEALALVDDFKPQIALIDIGLPGMSGHELARALRARFGAEALRLIALSGYGQATDPRAPGEAPAFERHLVKPVDFDELLALLSRPGAAGL